MRITLMMLFVKPDELASANSEYKLLKLDLKNESNLLSTSLVKVGFGASNGLNILIQCSVCCNTTYPSLFSKHL